MSKPINTQIPTAEILMATGVLREVGLDHEADKFRESLFNRDLLPAAVRALEQRIKLECTRHTHERSENS
ncbi:hypothetical protein [Stutzerimonas stutzeri]|uniref:hypothetical protein n=1 Tax=Stutzerimonas stutzeri TaxID=316 RepID=UPI002075EEDD|nr:hypothetical protein [Stutzerimonas stutzeri]